MGRDRDKYRDVEPEKARDEGNDPDAVRINRESSDRNRGAGRKGRGRAASEARQGTGARRAGGAGASQDTSQQQTRREEASPLRTDRQGGIRIEDTVVRKIAGLAAQEVNGIRTGGSTSQSVGGLLGASGPSSESRGVSVEVGEVEAAVDITATVAYGISIPQVSEAVRRNVINRVETLVGLRVTEVNITVNDVFFPEHELRQQQ